MTGHLYNIPVQAANGFMVILECSWARVLFVSDTITSAKYMSQTVHHYIPSCVTSDLQGCVGGNC